MGLRDVAVVSFAYSAVAKDDVHNEVEMIMPVISEAVAQSGISRTRDRLHVLGLVRLPDRRAVHLRGRTRRGRRVAPDQGEPRRDGRGVGAVRGVGDAADRRGRHRSRLRVRARRRSATCTEVFGLQTDPYYLSPLWPSIVHLAALQARAYLEANGLDRAGSRRGRVRGACTQATANPHAVRSGDRAGRRRCSRRPMARRPAAGARRRPGDRRRRRDGDRRGRRCPSRLRSSGLDPRNRPSHRDALARRPRPDRLGVDATRRRARRGLRRRRRRGGAPRPALSTRS